ncbi:o-succinylbenzoate synthase [Acidovorax sp. SDU_ACID1]|uniref:o-succinylbenzoate synthase n=1 Tax=Acidovorax sp. SDU_ACID1 TaxID=3136632 RepID=UPI00387354B6
MKIARITLRHVRMPFRHAFSTSRWTLTHKDAILVEAATDGGLTGWGECVALAYPDYCYESTAINALVLREYLVPLVLGRELADAQALWDAMSPVAGHRIAKAGLECAFWDLDAQARGQSLSTRLGGTRERVETGVSVSVHDTPEALLRSVEGYLREGYRRVKLKIKPGKDLVETALVRKHWPDLKLQVDGNAAYTLEHLDRLAGLDDLGLLLIEQPLSNEDIIDHAQLQQRMRTAVCLDESILSADDARKALSIGACRVINIKPGRVGGVRESVRSHDLCRAQGVPVWMGGMFETGIGRALNVAVASLPGFTLPGDISASSKYFEEDIVEEPFTLNADSTLTVPTAPGLGIRVDARRLTKYTVAEETFTASAR